MNITPTQRSITDYQLTLSEADAREAVDDPYTFVERLAEHLRAAGVTGGGVKPVAKARKLNGWQKESSGTYARTTGRKKAARPNGKGGPRKARAAAGDKPFSCPECGKTFKSQGWLSGHLSAKHPESESSSAAAPAAA